MTNNSTEVITELRDFLSSGAAAQGDERVRQMVLRAADELERLEIKRAEWAGIAGTRTAEVQLAEADAARYRWLKSHIAPTIINRIDKSLYSWPPARLDEIIDAQLKPVDVPARPAVCPACEGVPKAENNPCAVCGQRTFFQLPELKAF